MPQDLQTVIRVRDLGMEQQAVQRLLRVLHRRDGCVGAGRDDAKSWRCRLDIVAMARPDTEVARYSVEQTRTGLADLHKGMPEFPMRRRRDAPSQRVGHQLHAVADSQYGSAQLQHCRVRFRCTRLRNALRSAGQNEAGGFARAQLVDRGVEWQNLAVDRQLAQPARDQLRELRAEVEDENRLM